VTTGAFAWQGIHSSFLEESYLAEGDGTL